MNRRSTITTLLMAALLLMATSMAQADELGQQQIQQFIASMKKLQTMDDEFSALDDNDEHDNRMPDTDHLMSEGLARLKGHELYDKVNSIVQDYGFDSAEDWSRIGDRVMDAYIALQVRSQSGLAQREMAKALQDINDNPQLTPAQKEQMRAMMSKSMASMKSFADAPQADMDAIRPYQNALDAVINYDKQQ